MSVEVSTLYAHLKTLTKQWFYDKSEIDTELSDVVRTSATQGLVKNDGTIDTTSYQVAGNYIETSATQGLVKNDGTIDTTSYAPTSSLATVATSGSYEDLVDVPTEFTPTAHGHAASEITDSTAYTHLDTAANSTQAAINSAIDTKIGSLLAIELITVVATLPTASASTMNKLYLVAEETPETEDAYEIFVTVYANGTYAWEKVDTARIDLSGYALVNHVHGNITNDGKIGSNANYFVYTTTAGAVTSKEKIGNITTDGALGSESGKLAVTTTSGVLTTSDMVSEMDATIQQLIQYGENL